MPRICKYCGYIDETKSSGYGKQIKKKNLQQLSNWLNLTRERIFDDEYKDRKPQLIQLKKAIEEEFVIREEQGEEPMDLPEQGMLSVMGYHVGVTEGKTDEVRIDIMKSIIKGPLPLVGSISYMNQWGKTPKERARKLRNVLWSLRMRTSRQNEKAIEGWSHDIEWLDKNKNNLIQEAELNDDSWQCPSCDQLN